MQEEVEFRDTVVLRVWVGTSSPEPPWPQPLFHPLPAVWQAQSLPWRVDGSVGLPMRTWTGICDLLGWQDDEISCGHMTRKELGSPMVGLDPDLLTHTVSNLICTTQSGFTFCIWLSLDLIDRLELIQLWDSEHTHHRSVQTPFLF